MNLNGQRQLIRCIRDGFKNIWNHLFMSISSILTLTITLSLCALFVLFAENTSSLTRQIENEVQIFAEISEEVTEEEIEATIVQIRSMNIVDDVIFRTNDEEFIDVVERMTGGDPELEQVLRSSTDENPLAHTLTIAAVSAEVIPTLYEELDNMNTIGFVDFGGDSTLESLMDVTSTIRTVMIIIVGILLVLAVFLIQNTIRITIYSRQEELKIMQLVGASIPHVTIPFLIEGIIIGVIGAAIPIVVTLLGYPLIYDGSGGILVLEMFQLTNPEPLIFQIGFVLGLISIAVSIIGSLFAVSRYVFKK